MKKVVKGFASIIMFASMIFVVGCKPTTSTSEPTTGGSEPTGQSKITITVNGDAGITVDSKNTFTVDKGTEWKDIKIAATAKITVKENYELVEWRIGDKQGEVITGDNSIFSGNITVFAVSKEKVTITVAHDDNIAKIEPATLSVAKGSTWSAVKSKITVTPKTDFVHAGWKLNDASGTDLKDDYPFNSDTTVFAVSKNNK